MTKASSNDYGSLADWLVKTIGKEEAVEKLAFKIYEDSLNLRGYGMPSEARSTARRLVEEKLQGREFSA